MMDSLVVPDSLYVQGQSSQLPKHPYVAQRRLVRPCHAPSYSILNRHYERGVGEGEHC